MSDGLILPLMRTRALLLPVVRTTISRIMSFSIRTMTFVRLPFFVGGDHCLEVGVFQFLDRFFETLFYIAVTTAELEDFDAVYAHCFSEQTGKFHSDIAYFDMVDLFYFRELVEQLVHCLAVSCLADQDQRQDNKVSFHLSIVLNDY